MQPAHVRVRRFLEGLDTELDSTQILLTIRDPATWLASYVTYSYEFLRRGSGVGFAGYADRSGFPGYVDRWLARPLGDPDDVLDYNRFDERLSAIVGAERVRFLPLHLYGTPWYWEELARGTTLDPRQLQRWHEEDPTPRNVRQDPKGPARTWIAAPQPRLRGRLARRTTPGSILNRAVLSPYNLPLRGVSALTRRPRPKVVLTPELEARIIARYAESNRRFAARRGLDLDGHGYW